MRKIHAQTDFDFSANSYHKMRQKYLNKEISDDLWSVYCTIYLQKLMENHSDVLKRLK